VIWGRLILPFIGGKLNESETCGLGLELDVSLRSVDLDLRPRDLDLTISELEDLNLEKEDLDLPLWDLTTSLVSCRCNLMKMLQSEHPKIVLA